MLLAGCDGGALFQGKPKVQREALVTQAAVRVAGPEGFCVDTSLSEFGTQTAFVLFGNCAVIGNSESLTQPKTPAVVTVSVAEGAGGASIAQTSHELARFFETESGLGSLSRAGDPNSVELVESIVANGAVFLRARDTSAGNVAGANDTFWRGFLDAGSSVVVVSVVSFEEPPGNRDGQLAILQGFMNEIGGEKR